MKYLVTLLALSVGLQSWAGLPGRTASGGIRAVPAVSVPNEPYSVRRDRLLRFADRLAELCNQQHDVEQLYFVQRVIEILVYQTPPSLSPWDDVVYWTAVLNSAERTLNSIERELRQ